MPGSGEAGTPRADTLLLRQRVRQVRRHLWLFPGSLTRIRGPRLASDASTLTVETWSPPSGATRECVVSPRVTPIRDISFRNRRYPGPGDSLAAVNHDETPGSADDGTDPMAAHEPKSDAPTGDDLSTSSTDGAVEADPPSGTDWAAALAGEPEQPETHAPSPPSEVPVAAAEANQSHRSSRRSGLPTVLLALVGFGLVAVLAMQVYLLISANATSDEVENLEASVADLSDDLARVEGSVDEVGTQVAEIEAAGAAASPADGASPQAALEAGYLPRYEQGQQDLALGMPLATIEGEEYYSETAVSIDPTDGTRRVWLVWAHWCPYCQEELPELSTWWTENGDSYENIDLVGVTTSIDPSRGNPLEPYLDDLQLPFATVVDEDLTTAARFGTSAFPFWVVTDGDGTVLFRTAGLIPIEQVEAIFDQLRDMPA